MKKIEEPQKGHIQVYTGNGKGKTTAALGLSLHAAASGKKVYIAQFGKGMHYSELDIIRSFRILLCNSMEGRVSSIRNRTTTTSLLREKVWQKLQQFSNQVSMTLLYSMRHT